MEDDVAWKHSLDMAEDKVLQESVRSNRELFRDHTALTEVRVPDEVQKL